MKSCPGPIEQAKSISFRPSDEMKKHFEECSECKARWEAESTLVDSAQKLPDGIPSRAHASMVKSRLMVAVSPPKTLASKRYFYYAAAAASLLLMLTGYLLISMSPSSSDVVEVLPPSPDVARTPPSHYYGSIVTQVDAQYTHSIDANGELHDEIVHLRKGSLTLRVAPLKPNARFRVTTDDAEVEVRGTQFVVTAVDSRLTSVSVESGVVIVRPNGGNRVRLTAGGEWHSDMPSIDTGCPDISPVMKSKTQKSQPIKKQTRHHPYRKPSKRMEKSVSNNEKKLQSKDDSNKLDGNTYFKEGWALYKKGAAFEAALLFEKGIEQSGPSKQSEDLYFWRAVSLFKAGNQSKTGSACRAFLKSYQNSPRVPEVQAVYGWHLLRIGQVEAAADQFEKASHSPSGRIRDSARQGLSEIQNRLQQ